MRSFLCAALLITSVKATKETQYDKKRKRETAIEAQKEATVQLQITDG